MIELSPELILKAYACGVFPMAERKDDPSVFWVDPDWRGVIPLDEFHLPRRLGRTVRSGKFQISVDQVFDQVIRKCAEHTSLRAESWINDDIVEVYAELYVNMAYVNPVPDIGQKRKKKKKSFFDQIGQILTK